MGSQLPRTWQRTGGREGGILQIKAPAAAGLGPPSSGSPKHQRTGEPPASTGLIPPGLCEALWGFAPGCVCSCGWEQEKQQAEEQGENMGVCPHWSTELCRDTTVRRRDESWIKPGFNPGYSPQSLAFLYFHKEKESLLRNTSFVPKWAEMQLDADDTEW